MILFSLTAVRCIAHAMDTRVSAKLLLLLMELIVHQDA